MADAKVGKKRKKMTVATRGAVVNIDIDLADIVRVRGSVEALILMKHALDLVRGRPVGDPHEQLKR